MSNVLISCFLMSVMLLCGGYVGYIFGRQRGLALGTDIHIESIKILQGYKRNIKRQRNEYMKLADNLCHSNVTCNSCPVNTGRCDIKCELQLLKDETWLIDVGFHE